jgi:ubiquinone biosynthesis protein UbiJ
VQHYIQEVDALRDDTDRLEKRLEKLAEKLDHASRSSQES